VERQLHSLAVRRVRLIAEAQAHGATWEAIGTALGTTRQSAWETYSKLAREVLESYGDEGSGSEDELLASAADTLRRYRARRR